MLKRLASGAVLALTAAAMPASAQIGPHAASCRPGATGSAVLVYVNGFKARTGRVRVQIYSGNASEFLQKGRWVERVDLPVTASGPMPVCVRVPSPGNYAVAVRHDVDANGSSGWNDGGGFSRNPRVSLTSLRPKHRDVVIQVGPGVTRTNVVLNYRFGLSIRPVRTG